MKIIKEKRIKENLFSLFNFDLNSNSTNVEENFFQKRSSEKVFQVSTKLNIGFESKIFYTEIYKLQVKPFVYKKSEKVNER